MRKLLILSGKGGTGKTTIAAAFIHLSQTRCFADCDVDAPNLHLNFMWDEISQVRPFYGMDIARIDTGLCDACGICKAHCAFSAISYQQREYHVDTLLCEGCGLCERLCPKGAIEMMNDQAGDLRLFLSENVFSTAQLKMGKGNSGLLVSEVKNQLQLSAEKHFKDHHEIIAVIDGSPGIGCPVLASLSGVDMVLIVTEPSQSGLHDLKRIMTVSDRQQIPTAVCINKYDIDFMTTDEITAYVNAHGSEVVGKIPYDTVVLDALEEGVSIVTKKSAASDAIQKIYMRTFSIFKQNIKDDLVQFSEL